MYWAWRLYRLEYKSMSFEFLACVGMWFHSFSLFPLLYLDDVESFWTKEFRNYHHRLERKETERKLAFSSPTAKRWIPSSERRASEERKSKLEEKGNLLEFLAFHRASPCIPCSVWVLARLVLEHTRAPLRDYQKYLHALLKTYIYCILVWLIGIRTSFLYDC